MPTVEKTKIVCEIRGEPLEEGVVPIRYGLIRLSKEYLLAQRKFFPNANSFELGGCCIVGPEIKITTNVLFRLSKSRMGEEI